MQKFTLCDWVISPDELALYSTFETNKAKMDEIFNIGYEAAKKSYEELIAIESQLNILSLAIISH